jgi:hypothetical protein
VVVHTSVIPALRRVRQANGKLNTSLGYIARPCLKTTETTDKRKRNEKKIYSISIFIKKVQIKTTMSAGHKWLTPVIIATWEVEIGRIKVRGQSKQKVLKTSSQPITGHSGTCLSSQLYGG